MTSELSQFAPRLRELIPQFPVEAGAFESMALELFPLQFGGNAAYRSICEARRRTPLTVTHWSEIPAVPTSAFKELELTCLSPGQRTRVFNSSGTTEQWPSRHFHNAESLEVYEASLWAWHQRHLRFTISDLRLLCLTPPEEQAPHSSLVYMFEVIRQKVDADANAFVGSVGADGAWALDFDVALAAMTPGNPEPLLVLGTAFSFVHLLDELKSRNLRIQLPEGTQVMETGGYKGRSRELSKTELHRLISERLGVPLSHIVCEYGMSELSSQAYDVTCDKGQATRNQAETACHASRATRHFYFPPWARVQVVSPETGREVAEGDTGLLRVFDLANVFSVLAIQTEDLAVRRGDGFELIGRAKLAEPRGCSLLAR